MTIELSDEEAGLLLHALEKVRDALTGRHDEAEAYDAVQAMREACEIGPSKALSNLRGAIEVVSLMAKDGYPGREESGDGAS